MATVTMIFLSQAFPNRKNQIPRTNEFDSWNLEFGSWLLEFGYDRSLFPSCSLAAATNLSGSKPNFFWSSLSGAEAPKVFTPLTPPHSPTYPSPPTHDPSPTPTRPFTS